MVGAKFSYGFSSHSAPFLAAVPRSLILSRSLRVAFAYLGSGGFDGSKEEGTAVANNLLEESIKRVVLKYQSFAPSEQQLCLKFGIQSLKKENAVDYSHLDPDNRLKAVTSGVIEQDIEGISGVKDARLILGLGLDSGPLWDFFKGMIGNLLNDEYNRLIDY